MKADACLYATLEPLTSKATIHGLCKREIPRPEQIPCWDSVPVGTKLEAERLVGICGKCIKALNELHPDGKHMLYAVKTEEMKSNG